MLATINEQIIITFSYLIFNNLNHIILQNYQSLVGIYITGYFTVVNHTRVV